MHLYLLLNQSCQGEVVKEISELLPDVCIAVLAKAFVVEAIPGEELIGNNRQNETYT